METVYNIAGEKVGVVVKEGSEFVSYDISDFEVYRGPSANLAAWTLNRPETL